jgi:hypothetical protein
MKPDIYYIILDGYGRSDVLESLYSFDNSGFINYLKERGFYIAENSYSNYNQTALSLASSLNFHYLSDLGIQTGINTESRIPLTGLIKENQIKSNLNELGYQFVSYSSGYNVTEIINTDVYIPSSRPINHFEATFLSNTLAVFWLDRQIPIWYRNQILETFDSLAEMPKNILGPKFIFAHVLVPHPPFIFGPKGEALPIKGFRDGNYYNGTREEYIKGYRGQVIYINHILETLIDKILTRSDIEPIIILQGDHGPGAYLNWDTFEQTCPKERMAILNAYYIPGQKTEDLYPSVSPVYSFRIVFNQIFGSDLSLEPDEAYFSLWDEPYELMVITDMVDECNLIDLRY